MGKGQSDTLLFLVLKEECVRLQLEECVIYIKYRVWKHQSGADALGLAQIKCTTRLAQKKVRRRRLQHVFEQVSERTIVTKLLKHLSLSY